MRLADRCPRLGLALEQARAELAAFQSARCAWLGDVCRLEALVAHRELQLARCRGGRRAGGYMLERHRKLADARAALARVQRRRPVLGEHFAPSDSIS